MAAVTHVRTINYVATILGEDVELLEDIISNSDNFNYGDIVSVYAKAEETITAVTMERLPSLVD